MGQTKVKKEVEVGVPCTNVSNVHLASPLHSTLFQIPGGDRVEGGCWLWMKILWEEGVWNSKWVCCNAQKTQ